MRYWLMKSEPSDVSIDDLMNMPNQTVGWYGVRNYQARNFMRDQMQVGDLAFFYHSSCKEPGIVGIVEICTSAYPDPTQYEKDHKYYDPKSTLEQPRWIQVDVKLVQKTRYLALHVMRNTESLEGMLVLQRGNRLSITPVERTHWQAAMALLQPPNTLRP